MMFPIFQKILLIVLLWSILPGWESLAQSSQEGGTLIYRATDEVQALDPPLIGDSLTYNIAGNLFEGLVRYQGTTATIEPALAEEWKVSADGLKWTFLLRKGVIFHDGTPLTSEAVLFSLLRQKNAEHPFYNKDFLYKDVLFADVESLQAIDDYMIEFVLKRPYRPFLHVLTMPPAAIVSPTAVKQDPNGFGKRPVGTGPFRVVEWNEQDFILEPFESYWGTHPHLDRVVIRPAKFLKNLLLSMRQGNLHLAANVTPQELIWVRSDAEIKLKQQSSNQVAFFTFNMNRDVFQNRLVRLALQHILNKPALVKWLWQGNAVPAQSPIPPNHWSFRSVEDYPHDLEKAAQLLRMAGHEAGMELSLLVPERRDPSWPRLFKTFVAAARAIGVIIHINSVSFPEYIKAIQSQNYDMVWMMWATDHADPDGFIAPLLHSMNATPGNLSNLAYYKNEALDVLIEQAQQQHDPRKRTQIYHRIQHLLKEEVPWIPLMIPQISHLHHRKVHDVQLSVTGRVLLEKIWMENE